MQKINWKYSDYGKCCKAVVGCVVVYCNIYYPNMKNAEPRWFADVSITEQCGTFKMGPMRKSMTRAKDDTVRLARELLLEYHICLKAEMANFDLVE